MQTCLVDYWSVEARTARLQEKERACEMQTSIARALPKALIYVLQSAGFSM